MQHTKAAGIDAHGYVADVSDEDAVNAMVAKIKAEVGPVDILVNNAGLMKRVPMIEMSHADFMRVIDVHVGGAFNCSKAVLPDMMEKREGKIINICSMMSELGRETVSAYAAAKGALKMLTKNIASEYGEYNIQCNGMGPGYIATAQTAPLREVQPDGDRHPFDQFITAKTPAGRWGKPDDMVGPCVFLCKPRFRLCERSDPVRRRRHSGLHRPPAQVKPFGPCVFFNLPTRQLCADQDLHGAVFYEAASSLSYKTLLHVSSC